MKTRQFSRAGHRAAWMLAAALMLTTRVAMACPGCKQATEGRGDVSLSGASIGFSLGVFFMIAMVVGAIGYIGFLMYRSCKVLAARDRALMGEDAPAVSHSIKVAGLRPQHA